MKNKLKWIIVSSCLMPFTAVLADQTLLGVNNTTNKTADPLYRDFRFDSAKLLQMNSAPLLAPHVLFNGTNDKKAVATNQSPANGFFLYKLQPTQSHVALPSNPFAVNESNQSNSTFYGHLFQKLVKHIFVDLAGGYEPNTNPALQTSSMSDLYKYNMSNPSYSKNWFASASALFTHTWKEFAFNANLGLTHAEANQDPYNLYFAQTLPTEQISSLQSKVSFLHENAELSYKMNSLFQPFVGGGFLQVMNPNNNAQSMMNFALPNSFDPNLDTNGYKIGGGLSLNYKQYVLRLEQQYFQRGALYHNNQSTLSFKVNLG